MVGRGLRIGLGFALGAILLVLFFWSLDLRRVLHHAREGDPYWLAIAVGFQAVHVLVRCLRWRLLLSPVKADIGLYNLFSTTVIGYLVTMLLPLRLGEVLRPVLLGRREGISRTAAVATCVLERLMDALTVALLLGFYLVLLPDLPASPAAGADLAKVRRAGLVVGLSTLAIFPLLYLLVHYRGRVHEALRRRWGAGEPLLPRLLHAFLSGFDAVRDGRVFATAWAQSIAVWLVITGSVWASLRAFDLPIGFAGSMFMMALLTIGIAVPTQGGLGGYEYAGQLGLVAFFGVEPNRAAASILVTHLFAVGPVMLAGALLLWRDGLDLRSLIRLEGPGGRAPVTEAPR